MFSGFKTKSLLPLLNGLVGENLAVTNPGWVIGMSLRAHGDDVNAVDLGKRLKKRPVVIFVHGLMADERIWTELSKNIKSPFQEVFIRYNSGLHISTNGQQLSLLLEALVQTVRPREIALVGHSMGGLIIRSAGYYGEKANLRWPKVVKKIFLLAVPNEGAVLEKLSHAAAFTLRKIARFQLGLIGNFLDGRSDGIKDLRLGSMVDEDWRDPKRSLRDHFKRQPVEPMPRVKYFILVGSLMKNDQSLMAKYFGDGLVTHGSAIPKTLMHVSEIKIFAGTGHNSLLNSKKVGRFVSDKLRV